MSTSAIGEGMVLLGVLVVFGSIIALATGQSAPVDLEMVSWGGAGLAFVGIIAVFLSS